MVSCSLDVGVDRVMFFPDGCCCVDVNAVAAVASRWGLTTAAAAAVLAVGAVGAAAVPAIFCCVLPFSTVLVLVLVPVAVGVVGGCVSTRDHDTAV